MNVPVAPVVHEKVPLLLPAILPTQSDLPAILAQFAYRNAIKFVRTPISDAAINPGNSGGPLFSKDRGIGVNTAKMARGTEGVGFAVHYSELTKFLSQ